MSQSVAIFCNNQEYPQKKELNGKELTDSASKPYDSLNKVEKTAQKSNEKHQFSDERVCQNLSAFEQSLSAGKRQFSDLNEDSDGIERTSETVQLGSITLKTKFSHLLPDHKQVPYSPQIKNIIFAQQKLDEYLFFIDSHREKTKGEKFSQIKRNVKQNSRAQLNLLIFRKILFIAPQFYHWKRTSDEENSDLIIKVVKGPQLASDLEARKRIFRDRLSMFIYKQNKKVSHEWKDSSSLPTIEIPCYEFKSPKQINSGPSLSRTLSEQSKILFSAPPRHKVNCKEILKNQDVFKQKLEKLIEVKQAEYFEDLKKRQEGKAEQAIKRSDMLEMLDQINFIYRSKNVQNLYMATLLENLNRNLKDLPLQRIHKIVQKLMAEFDCLFRVVSHRKAEIVQINRKKFNEVKRVLQQQIQGQNI